jgi:hypothetical protein
MMMQKGENLFKLLFNNFPTRRKIYSNGKVSEKEICGNCVIDIFGFDIIF